jgi:ABC-2 type transport system ATP-binding protein
MIEVKQLTKQFGPKTAVDGISFSVDKGQVLGFLGPNGAGKSTTMRMITGYMPPTAGAITIGGLSIVDSPINAKQKVGYLPENAPLYADMTVESFLNFSAELRGLSGADKSKAIDKAIDTCFLDRVRRQSLDTLSKGYKHRTCLAQSILHDPEVLILDEPTDGLDPNQKQEVRNLIRRMGESKTIIFSTHILEEVEAVCSRAIIIDQGKIVADGTPDDLKRRASRAGSLQVQVKGAIGSTILAELEKLSHVEKVNVEQSSGDGFVGRLMPKKSTVNGTLQQEFLGLCQARSWSVLDMHLDPGRLDEMFREITSQIRN